MANLETIRIGLGALSANQCIPWLCREAGLFREEGLDAVIAFEPPAVRTLAVVVDGEVDVGLFGGYPVVRAAVECKNAEIVLNLNGFNHLSIVAQPGIESPRDLKGRRIGGFSLKGNADFTLDLLFAEWGLTGEPGDPERVPYWDGFQAACEGLLAGEVEAAILPRCPSAAGPSKRDMTYQGGVGFALKSLAAEKKELADRFLRAHSMGVRRFKSDPDLARRVLRDNLPSMGDEENLEATYAFWAEHIPDPPVPSLEGVQVILDGISGDLPKARSVRPIDCVAKALWPQLKAD
ncbi:MAG TPA: ABC transporter substrate-binding protein [Nitrospinota bacterium]|nr:ABC transporter substrate-binding protein [Nitrospinota bacterium]